MYSNHLKLAKKKLCGVSLHHNFFDFTTYNTVYNIHVTGTLVINYRPSCCMR